MGVRNAKEDDLERVIEIEELTSSDAWGYYNFQSALEDIFLVFDEQGIFGFLVAVCCYRAAKGAIVKLAVHPQHRRQGIATQLLDAALRIFRDREIFEVCLIVEIIRKPAIALYERFGFKITETLHTNSEDDAPDDAFYEMKLNLPSELS
jgi:ribosomal-protein-alanine N-acetyltransferase